jgi:hypothetical protein
MKVRYRKSPPGALKEVRARWRQLPAPLAKLAQLLLKATPDRSASMGNERWLLVEHRHAPKVARGSGLDPAEFEPERITVWLPQPPPVDRVQQAVRSAGAKAPRGLVEFFATFGLLRIAEPSRAGAFELPSVDSRFPSSEDEIFETWVAAPKWKGSMVVYRAPNGDKLLLHPKGRTAWAQLERGAIVPFTRSFFEAIDEFRHSVNHCATFDSWYRR